MPALVSDGEAIAFCIRRLSGVKISVTLSPAEYSRSPLSGSEAVKPTMVGRSAAVGAAINNTSSAANG